MNKPCYSITVEKRVSTFALYASKCYGDCLGVAACFGSPSEVLAEIRRHIKLWQSFDAIVNRQSDPVTEANTVFTSNTPLVTEEMVFHPEQKMLPQFISSEKQECKQ